MKFYQKINIKDSKIKNSTDLAFLDRHYMLVGVTGFEPAASTSQRNLSRFFAWFTRLFGAFVSENDAFGCSCKHCFHVVRSRRWSKVWSRPFRWDQNAVRKSKIRLRINSFSAVIIPYISAIVKRLLSTLKNCIAVVKEKAREKSPDLFSEKCWTSSLFCGMLLCWQKRRQSLWKIW